jgi:hypothetical protein
VGFDHQVDAGEDVDVGAWIALGHVTQLDHGPKCSVDNRCWMLDATKG